MTLDVRYKFQAPPNELISGLFSGSSFFEDEKKFRQTTSNYPNINWKKYIQYSDKIKGFSNLNENWDSYGAERISQMAIDVAIQTLDSLNMNGERINGISINIFPMRDGGIQFEFDGKYVCAELEINPLGETTFIFFNNDGDIKGKKNFFELSELPTLIEEAQYD